MKDYTMRIITDDEGTYSEGVELGVRYMKSCLGNLSLFRAIQLALKWRNEARREGMR